MDIMTVKVLVLENEPSLLPIITSMLKSTDYQVVLACNHEEALDTLRMGLGPRCNFDLVLSDMDTPINPFEFQTIVDEEFHIPVILMSTEHKRSTVITEPLQTGLPFFLDRPPLLEDLMTIRQYIISMKTDREHHHKRKRRGEDLELAKETRRKRKPKLRWTNDLHNKFLQAINSLGFQRAAPGKIIEYMNVPGLTRENIASHLQKYRGHMKQLCKRIGFSSNAPPNFYHENYNVNSPRQMATLETLPMPTLTGYAENNNNNNNNNVYALFQGLNILNSAINTQNPNPDSSNLSNSGTVNNYVRPISTPIEFGTINYAEKSSNLSNFGSSSYIGESSNPNGIGDQAMQFIKICEPTLNLGKAGQELGQTTDHHVISHDNLLLANNDVTMNHNLGIPQVEKENKANSYSLNFDDDALERFVNGDTYEEETLINDNASILQYMKSLEQDFIVPANVPAQVPVAQNYTQQKTTYSEFSSESNESNIFQDRGANYLHDFSKEGMDGIGVILSSFSGNNESNNQLL